MPRPSEDQVLDAVRSGDLETLKQHLARGGDANLRGSGGQLTLLQIATQNGDLDAVSALTRRRDCRINERSGKNGDTALIVAVKRGHTAVARHLILLGGCDLNAQNNEGFTALMKAAKRGMGSIMLLLLQHGADMEAASIRGGHTALTLAVASQKPKVVELLLQFGASLEHRTLGGKSPEDIAWELKSDEPESKKQNIVKRLLEAKRHREDVKRDTGFSTDVLNGQYKIVSIIGSGTFGCVFLTDNLRSKSTEARVVVKAMKPRSNKRTADIDSEGMHEARLMQMIDHPLVVNIIQYFKVDKHFCIAMEYCEFGDLDTWMQALARKRRQFPKETAMHWFLQMLLALDYLHSNNILHRDLKPKNIFLKHDATAKIGDFGLSRRLLGTGDYASTVAGTVMYMCPEILCRINRPAVHIDEVPVEGYDAKCDVWSLGCILYELCTCKMLFHGENIKEMVCGDAALPHLPRQYPGELDELFARMMERQRKSRASCDQLLGNRMLQQELSDMKRQGCAADVKFLRDNCHLLTNGAGIADHLASSDDEDTLVPEGGGNDHLWRAVDSVLNQRAPDRIRPRYDLEDDSISDTVPDSIVEALAERVRLSGFPLEQIYRRSLVMIREPPARRRADYARFTDDLESCELVEDMVLCEFTQD